MSNLQKMFDKAVAGLATQNFVQSIVVQLSGINSCVFRGPKGRKCAIGHCLEDDEIEYETYNNNEYTKFESNTGTCMVAAKKYDVTLTEIDNLQTCHDASKTPERMKKTLVLFAATNNLILPDVLK